VKLFRHRRPFTFALVCLAAMQRSIHVSLLCAAVVVLAGAINEAHLAATAAHAHFSAGDGRAVLGLKHSGAKRQSQATAVGLDGRQPQTTTTTHTSFLQRLKDACAAFVVGLVLIFFSIPVLWFNESRSARMESLLSWAVSQCRTVAGSSPEKANRDWLVHVQGEHMKTAAPTRDRQFDVSFEQDCLRLRSTVEVFQIIQHTKSEEKEKFGGGKETVTTYSYTTEWSSTWHDSSGYQDRSRVNRRPPGLELGPSSQTCGRVEYGEAFVLTEELVTQCCEWRSAAPRLGDAVRLQSGNKAFHRSGDDFFYSRYDGNKAREQPVPGDARVKFEYVPDGPATVLALQVAHDGQQRDAFLPYRLISRAWCGWGEEQEKAALRKLGAKPRSELAAEAQCGTGCLWCLCCACNLVNMCFASLLVPEVYHLFAGSHSSDECFRRIRSTSKLMTWGLRALGWVMMFIGLYSLFAPFLTFIKVIPWLGPILSSLGGWLIWFICLVGTLAVATVIICLAYLFYHPLLALLYGAIAAAIVVVPLVLIGAK